MGKRSRRRAKQAKPERIPFVARTFDGLPGECDWVAMREIVPAATARVSLSPDVADGRELLVCSLLPGGAPGLVREDGTICLGLQVQHDFGDAGRDLAAVVENGLAAEPGTSLHLVESPGRGRRLQDLVDPASTFEVQVHDGFDFWVADTTDPADEVVAGLEAANEAAVPTLRLHGVEAAYWTQLGERRYLRWVLPYDEERLLDALARLRAAGADRLGDGTRLIGMFRAHGLLVPVWELEGSVEAEQLEGPAAALLERVDETLADARILTRDERAARNGLASRQLTIR